MARLRLFANLRELAGTAAVEIEAATVADLVDLAERRFGERFAEGVAHARIWVNGEAAVPSTPLRPSDEVALVPPVSGGAMVVEVPVVTRVGLAAALVAALLVAGAVSLEALVVVAVGVTAAWVWDVSGFAVARGVPLNVYPMLLAAIGPVWGAYRWGFDGFAFGSLAAAALVPLWAIVEPRFRRVESVSVTVLGTVLVAAGAGPLVLLRIWSNEELIAFLVVVIGAMLAGLAVATFPNELSFLDARTATLAGAIFAGAVAGAFWGPSWGAVFVGSIAAAAGLLAGRTVGSLLRAGRIEPAAPGYLSLLDGPLAAAGMFWAAVALAV